MNKKKVLTIVLFALLIYAYTFITLWSHREIPEVTDEVQYQLHNYFYDYLINGKFDSNLWEGDSGSFDQTLLGSYYYGFIQSRISKVPLNQYAQIEYEVSKKYGDDWEVQNRSDWNKFKSKSELFYQNILTIRKINIVFSSFTVVIVGLTLLTVLNSYIFVLLFVIILLTNSVFVDISLAVRNDWILLSFISSTFLSFILLARYANSKKLFIFSLFPSVLLGFSLAAKLTGSLNAYLLLLLIALWGMFTKRNTSNKFFLRIFFLFFIICSISFAVFFLLHPNIWHSPLSSILRYISVRYTLNLHFQETNSSQALVNFPLRLVSFLFYTMNINFFRMNLLDPDFLTTYSKQFFFLLGISSFAYKTYTSQINQELFIQRILALIWFLGTIVYVIFLSPMFWPQYYYIAIPPTIFFISYGLYFALTFLLKFIMRNLFSSAIKIS